MAELKTKQNNANVSVFIDQFADSGQKRRDSFELLKLNHLICVFLQLIVD